jgi:hypothetical protein
VAVAVMVEDAVTMGVGIVVGIVVVIAAATAMDAVVVTTTTKAIVGGVAKYAWKGPWRVPLVLLSCMIHWSAEKMAVQ